MNTLLLSIGVIVVLVLCWFFMHVSIVRSYTAKAGRQMSVSEASWKVLRDMKRVFIQGKKPEMLLPPAHAHGAHHQGEAPVRGIPSAVGHGPGKRPAKRAKQRKKG
jgi:hypothetical protein